MTELDYVARCPECKNVVAVVSGTITSHEGGRKDLSKTVASWIRDGLSLERVDFATVRDQMKSHQGCKWDRKKAKASEK